MSALLTVSRLKASDIPDPEAFGSYEVLAYSKRRGALCEWPLSKGRERSTGRIYYCLRLADGCYGVCQRCGEVIEPARLQALPAAEFCLSCADRAGV